MFRYLAFLSLIVIVWLPLPSAAALRVFACEPEWAALIKELAGDKVKVDTATRPGQDPHYVQARPSLISKIRRADLLVCTGADLEAGWLPLLLRKGNNKRILIGHPGHLMIADTVQLKEKPVKLDRSEGDVHAAGNPHLQTDPRNMLSAATAIVDRLVQLDHDNATLYRNNLTAFKDRWQEAVLEWQLMAIPLPGRCTQPHSRVCGSGDHSFPVSGVQSHRMVLQEIRCPRCTATFNSWWYSRG
jgi:zinc/manganese transport system substrate-binding protein